VWSKALKARVIKKPSPHGAPRSWRGASALATVPGVSERRDGWSNDKRATAPETAYGCTGGATL
jgi:hypothetical protein